MIGTIIWIIGLILCIKAILEIVKMNISTAGKAISIIILVITSWVGLAVYYFYAKKHLTEWFK